jgi:hypothetical protein
LKDVVEAKFRIKPKVVTLDLGDPVSREQGLKEIDLLVEYLNIGILSKYEVERGKLTLVNNAGIATDIPDVSEECTSAEIENILQTVCGK